MYMIIPLFCLAVRQERLKFAKELITALADTIITLLVFKFMFSLKYRLFLLWILLLSLTAAADNCQKVRVVPERLPDLHVPRSGHCIFYAGGELTVIGGHSSGFVPTQTAEYFSNGEWHPMTMTYCHDNGFAVALPTGEVIIGGGHNEPLGVGQTFLLERYTPATHSFEGFGCLDRRRALSKATLMQDGRVIIAGNHYTDDGIGCYDGHPQVEHLKDVVQQRSNPYILHTSDNDLVIVSACNQYAHRLDTVWADRLKGNAFRVPLLEEWLLFETDMLYDSESCAMGGGDYLLTVERKDGQIGFVIARDTCFTLLPTNCPVPMNSQQGPIFYKGQAVVDSLHRRGFLIGVDSLFARQYILCVDYAKRPARLTLYYSDTPEHAAVTPAVLTPDGDLLLVGGISGNSYNYKPLSTVWLYRFGTAAQNASSLSQFWVGGVFLFAVILAFFAYIIVYKGRKKQSPTASEPPMVTDGCPSQDNEAGLDSMVKMLYKRICKLMDDDQLYLRCDLKLQDVAVLLGTNSSYISECINSVHGQTFPQFVNAYRVRHAQKLMRQQPDMKNATIASESGFSSEVSFFRNFKAVTGMTPREWVGKL